MTQKPIFICAVVGPTASGKTSLAVEIAKEFNGEIVSFDSMQIYKDAPIATAIPTMEERQGIVHHLMGFLDCNQQFSVAKYMEPAKETIQSIADRGKLPVLVGGTGLYYSSLVDNITFQQQGEEHMQCRQELEQRANQVGIEALYEELCQIDSEAAKKIHMNNRVRVIRALEIYYTTGKTLTCQEQESRSIPSPYVPCVIGINYRDRNRLYDRINARVHVMLQEGLLEEVKNLYDNHPNGTILQAIGVKEFAPYFNGECTLEEVVETIQQESRRYAKRQLTWFRRDSRVQWLYPDECADTCEFVLRAKDIVRQAIAAFKEEKR